MVSGILSGIGQLPRRKAAAVMLYRFCKGIRMAWVEDFVTGHDGYQVLGIAQVDNVVCPAGDHVDGLDFVAGNFKFYRLPRVDVPLLDQAVAVDHDELLPLGVVPVLALGDAGLGNIDAHLAAVGGVDQLGEAAPGIAVHFHGVFELLLGEVSQVQAEQLLGKAAIGDPGHEKGYRLVFELGQQVHDFPQGNLVGTGDAAVASVVTQDGLYAVKLAVPLLAL